jgi:hypothetical protein
MLIPLVDAPAAGNGIEFLYVERSIGILDLRIEPAVEWAVRSCLNHFLRLSAEMNMDLLASDL